jgi:hypothetical protein
MKRELETMEALNVVFARAHDAMSHALVEAERIERVAQLAEQARNAARCLRETREAASVASEQVIRDAESCLLELQAALQKT